MRRLKRRFYRNRLFLGLKYIEKTIVTLTTIKLNLNVKMNSRGYKSQQIITSHINNNQFHSPCFISPPKARSGRVILVDIRNIRLLRFKHKNMKSKVFTFHFSMIQTVNKKFQVLTNRYIK